MFSLFSYWYDEEEIEADARQKHLKHILMKQIRLSKKRKLTKKINFSNKITFKNRKINLPPIKKKLTLK